MALKSLLSLAAIGYVGYRLTKDYACHQYIDKVIDEASEDSFPASDPPAWTNTRS